MKNIVVFISGAFLGCILSAAFFTLNINKESTHAIEQEISQYKNTVSSLDSEIAMYSGGLLPSLLKIQRAMYQDIIASLEAKKIQIAHWITLSFPTNTNAISAGEGITELEKEVSDLKNKIEEGKRESAQYSPCLIKSLIDLRVAQEKLTLASLERTMIAKRYNLPLIQLPNGENKGLPNKKKRPENPELDRDSL